MSLKDTNYADPESVLNNEYNEDKKIDKLLVPLRLEKDEKQILDGIIKAESKTELERQFGLFNMNQSKKNALRIIKLESLLGRIEDQTIARFENRPDQVSNKELLDYIQVISAQIDRSQKKVDDLSNKDVIIQKPVSSTVNINVGQNLTEEDKEVTLEAVRSIMDLLKESSNKKDVLDAPIEEAELVTPIEENNSTKEEITPLSLILEKDK